MPAWELKTLVMSTLDSAMSSLNLTTFPDLFKREDFITFVSIDSKTCGVVPAVLKASEAYNM